MVGDLMNNKDFQNGFIAGAVSGGVVEVEDTTKLDNLETLIDQSGVLDSTEGSVSDKVEQLIGKAEELDVFQSVTNANTLFHSAKSFPSKAVVNLLNAKTVYQAFAYWNTEPIPMVEEINVNAPNLSTSDALNQMFVFNNGVKKVILNTNNERQQMASAFQQTKSLEEVVLNFSTKNITNFTSTFNNSNVKRIIGVLDFSSATKVGSTFLNCYKLEKVRFEPNSLSLSINLSWCSELTSESVQSIFDGLATVTTAQTLTLNANAKILQSQVDSANAKGWTVAGGTVVSEEEYYG